MPRLTITPATEPDLTTYLHLRDTAAEQMVADGIVQWQPGELTETTLRDWLGDGTLYAARLEDELVGGLMLMWSDSFWEEHDDGAARDDAGYTHGLLVDRAYKGAGLGGELLAFAERTISAAGRGRSRLDTVTANDTLRRYYRAAGYREVGERVFQGAKVFDTGAPIGAVTLFEKELV